MATLFWKFSDRETRLEQNITHILKSKPGLVPLFENITTDKSTHFLNLFFPFIPDPITFYVEPYRVCRRPTFLRECPDDKTQIYP